MDMEADYRRRAGRDRRRRPSRAARIALGGVERVKDDVRDARGTRLLEDIVERRRVRRPHAAPQSGLRARHARDARHRHRRHDGRVQRRRRRAASAAAVRAAGPARSPLPERRRRTPTERGFVTPVHFLEFRRRVSSFANDGGAVHLRRDRRRHRHRRRRATHSLAAGVGRLLRRRARAAASIGRGFLPDEEETGARVVVLSRRPVEGTVRRRSVGGRAER